MSVLFLRRDVKLGNETEGDGGLCTGKGGQGGLLYRGSIQPEI